MKKIIKQHNIFLSGKIRPILRDAKTKKIIWIGEWNNNIIPLVGLRAIARRYGKRSTISNEGAVTYGAVGKGATSPASSDTQMQDEIERKLIFITTESAAIIHLEVFFNEGEANDDITKFALFGEDASATINSGTLMEYADFDTPFTKTSSETLTVEVNITISTT